MLLQVLNVEEGNTTNDRSASNVNTDLRGCVYVCMSLSMDTLTLCTPYNVYTLK